MRDAVDALAVSLPGLRGRRLWPLVGGGASGRRWRIAAGIALLIGMLGVIPAPHRVTADASVRGEEQRTVVAPLDGYLEAANVRPGDDVRKGDVLATLDTRELRLEREKWSSLLAARRAEYQDALARRNRTEVSILRSRIEQLQAELALVASRIERTELRAPYAGVIVSGDLNQSLGSPVKTGQILFEIAPLDAYRVELEVSEHDIAAVRVGMRGKVHLAALPNATVPVTVQRLIPVAQSGEGKSWFRVEATLDEPPAELRPGMRGVGKITAGRRSVLWVWTHSLVDRVRLLAWSLGF